MLNKKRRFDVIRRRASLFCDILFMKMPMRSLYKLETRADVFHIFLARVTYFRETHCESGVITNT